MQSPLTIEQVEQLKTFDTCVIADAIESFGVRLRNEGFATVGFRCLFKSLPSHGGLRGHLQSTLGTSPDCGQPVR